MIIAPVENEFQRILERSGRITGEEEKNEKYSCSCNTHLLQLAFYFRPL